MLKKLDKKTKIIFIIILFLYFFFIYLDYSLQNTGYKYSIVAKYLSILLCFIMTIMIGKNGHDIVDTRLLQSGFFLTACADYCLLLSNKFIVGVIIFCIVQTIYIFRYTRDLTSRSKIFWAISIIYIILSITLLTVFNTQNFDLRLSLICLFYGCLIIVSLITAVRTLKANYFPLYSSVMICIGMILFLMCDINVVLFNIFEENGNYAARMCGFLIWVFYLPAQVLLALSGYKDC